MQQQSRGAAVLAMAGTAALGLVLDQASKYLAVAHLDPNHPVPLLGGLLTLELIRNPGAAFSLGSSSTILFSCLALAATIAVVVLVPRRLNSVGQGVLAGMALAGIAGNLIDRMLRPPAPMRGHVVDFFHLQHFAIFNVADIFITLTAVALVLGSLRNEHREQA